MRFSFRRFPQQTFVRFLVIGLLNTLFGGAVMFFCYRLLHLGYWVSSAANYLLGSVFSYCCNKRFTFRNREKGVLPALRFALHILLCYISAYAIAQPLAASLLARSSPAHRDTLSMMIGMVFFILLNYLGKRFFAFAPHRS